MLKKMFLFLILLMIANLLSCGGSDHSPPPAQEIAAQAHDPAEITIGERLFLETRFAQFFHANQVELNAPLPHGDPTLSHTLTINEEIDGPFQGESMNCAACHLVDQHLEHAAGGMRSYSDFAPRPPIPLRSDRADFARFAPRNTQSLVGIKPPDDTLLLHFDGEFITLPDLVKATLIGRNYGWLADEAEIAIQHIAAVIRNDDGQGALAADFGGSYTRVLTGTDPTLASEFQLPTDFRVDVANASDAQLFNAVAKLISAYVDDLAFSMAENDVFNGSPYDTFLVLNELPQQPQPGESTRAYAARLLAALDTLNEPKFVQEQTTDRTFAFHAQAYEFGQPELHGLKLFLRTDTSSTNPAAGNCASCHAPPHFSDFGLHNTGASQIEYDAAHGEGAFLALSVPNLATRNTEFELYLPATPQHPSASGRFRAIVDAADPQRVDLGVWNIFANPDIPQAQSNIRSKLCLIDLQTECSNLTDQQLLERAVAVFKTPLLRDLGHSAPYMHNGQFSTIREVVQFYQDVAELTRAGKLRNADPELGKIQLLEQDIDNLSAFINALNEDYE